MKRKRMSVTIIVTVLIFLLSVPAAAAQDPGINLVINGTEMSADMHVQDDRVQISSYFLNKIPGLSIQETGYTPLRAFFENKGGTVNWNGETRTVNVSWRETMDNRTARDLLLRANKALLEHNTYHMTGSTIMNLTTNVPGTERLPGPATVPMTVTFDAVMQHKPLKMYIRQKIDMAALMPDKEMPQDAVNEIVTEMVWTEEAIYQKTHMDENWIRMDLTGMETMNKFTQMMQANPQQSIEMMDAFGILTVFGDEKKINGKEYYTLRTYVDTDTFRKALEQMLGGMNLGEMISAEIGISDDKTDEVQANVQKIMDSLIKTMTLNYYVDSYINKETLLTEYTDFDMVLNYTIDESISPEGPVTISMKITGSLHTHSFGVPVVFPDVSNAVSMEEIMKQQIEQNTNKK